MAAMLSAIAFRILDGNDFAAAHEDFSASDRRSNHTRHAVVGIARARLSSDHALQPAVDRDPNAAVTRVTSALEHAFESLLDACESYSGTIRMAAHDRGPRCVEQSSASIKGARKSSSRRCA